MDDFQTEKPANQNLDKPIPFDDGMSVSHAPLNLGGPGPGNAPEGGPPPAPAVADTGRKASWPDRVTGVKTFYTKLHGGAIEFMDDIISRWLRDNPGVQVKRTNTVTGDVVGKKTEPNLIITIWY